MNLNDNNKPIQELCSSIEQVYKLKAIPRSGWVQSGIAVSEVESIAAHSYGMSMLILFLRDDLAECGVNLERALHMALIHDVAESIVGDLTPRDSVSADAKHAAEAVAYEGIMKNVDPDEYLRNLWIEFEAGQSLEAQLVKRIDKLDMLLQASIYEKQFTVHLDSFWEEMDQLFKDTESEPIYDYIRLSRSQTKGSRA